MQKCTSPPRWQLHIRASGVHNVEGKVENDPPVGEENKITK